MAETGRQTLKGWGFGGGGCGSRGVAAGARRVATGRAKWQISGKTGVLRRLGAGWAGAEKRVWAGGLGRAPAVARRGGEGRGGAQGGGKGRDRSRRRAFLGGNGAACGLRRAAAVAGFRVAFGAVAAAGGERKPVAGVLISRGSRGGRARDQNGQKRRIWGGFGGAGPRNGRAGGTSGVFGAARTVAEERGRGEGCGAGAAAAARAGRRAGSELGR